MLKGIAKEKMKIFTVRMLPSEMALLQKKANKYTEGNVSAWLRYCGANHQPKKKELSK